MMVFGELCNNYFGIIAMHACIAVEILRKNPLKPCNHYNKWNVDQRKNRAKKNSCCSFFWLNVQLRRKRSDIGGRRDDGNYQH